MERVGVVSLLVVCSIFILNSLNDVYANSEGDALYDFKRNLNQNHIGSISGWDPTLINPCTWEHVYCNPAESVTSVELGNAELFGELHLDLSQLPNLEDLELYSNTLYGVIPDSLTLSTKLRKLQLYDNVLEGPVPGGFTKISSLEMFDLGLNNLNGTLPEWTGTQENLYIINLSGNMLTGSVPKSWDVVIQKAQLVNLTNNHAPTSNGGVRYLTGSCTEQPCINK